MLDLLRQRDAADDPIRVALIGAGSMGLGIAWQIGRTPGMRLVSVTDLDISAARAAAEAYGSDAVVVDPDTPLPDLDEAPVLLSRDPFFLLERPDLKLDVVVESTNTIGFAGRVSEAAIDAGAHVVMMNAEVDLALGPWLAEKANQAGVVVTSDAGDQHGVLARMIEEIQLWGFDIAMAGNIKGFLDQHATAEALAHEAAIRHLNPIQCCAYTDGTKLSIEMALLSNGYGLVPWVTGMEGPKATDVREVFEHFDFERYGGVGVVDYLLGAEPGGGVYVVGRCDDPLQARYLSYYKLGDGPFYLFYRPYHLCHLETTRAIARAALYGEAVLQPWHGRVADVYAFAKRDLVPGEKVEHGIGGDRFYGMIERCEVADAKGWVPIALLEPEVDRQACVTRKLQIDAPLTYDDVDLPDTFLRTRFAEHVGPAAVAASAAT